MSQEVVQGMGALLAKLERLGGNTQEAVDRATKKITELSAGDARRLAPANKRTQSKTTGGITLRSGIHTAYETVGKALEGSVVSSAPHAHYVEFGTGKRGNASPSPPKWDGPLSYRADWAGMAAQPYLFPVAAKNKPAYVEGIRQEVTAALNKLGGD